MKRIKISSIITAGLLLVASAEFTMTMEGFKPAPERSVSTNSVESNRPADSTNNWVKVNSSQSGSSLPQGSIGALAESSMTPKQISDRNISINADLAQHNGSLPLLRADYEQKATPNSIDFNQLTAPAENQKATSINIATNPSIKSQGTKGEINFTPRSSYSPQLANFLESPDVLEIFMTTTDKAKADQKLQDLLLQKSNDPFIIADMLTLSVGSAGPVGLKIIQHMKNSITTNKNNPARAIAILKNELSGDNLTNKYNIHDVTTLDQIKKLYTRTIENLQKKLNQPTKTQSPLYDYIATSLSALWNRDTATASTIRTAVMSILKQSNATMTPTEQNTVASDIAQNVPPADALNQVWTKWIQESTQKIYDAIFETPATKQAKTVNAIYDATFNDAVNIILDSATLQKNSELIANVIIENISISNEQSATDITKTIYADLANWGAKKDKNKENFKTLITNIVKKLSEKNTPAPARQVVL